MQLDRQTLFFLQQCGSTGSTQMFPYKHPVIPVATCENRARNNTQKHVVLFIHAILCSSNYGFEACEGIFYTEQKLTSCDQKSCYYLLKLIQEFWLAKSCRWIVYPLRSCPNLELWHHRENKYTTPNWRISRYCIYIIVVPFSTACICALLSPKYLQTRSCSVDIARKVLPHPQGINGSMHSWIRGCLYDPALPGRDVRRDSFDVLKKITVHEKNYIIF
jgi:hypothetical protein